MRDAIPLLLLILMLARNSTAFAASPKEKKRKKSKEPPWPTPSSPPPIPAFQPKQSADPGGTSTPLAQLHKAPPKVARPKTALDTTRALAKKGKGFYAAIKPPFYARLPLGTKKATSTALVANLQKIINSHGGKLTPDGLYGPRTASAWSTLAKRKGLAPDISRQGPKIAKVVTATFEQLQVPPIP